MVRKSILKILKIFEESPDVFLSVEDIIKLSGLSERTVREALKELELSNKIISEYTDRGKKMYKLKPDSSDYDQVDYVVVKDYDESQAAKELNIERRGPVVIRPTSIEKRKAKFRPTLLPWIRPLQRLYDEKEKIREILSSMDPQTFEEYFHILMEESEKDKENRRNIFKTVEIIQEKNCIIDGIVHDDYDPFTGIICGSASDRKREPYRLPIGDITYTIFAYLYSGAGLGQVWENGEVREKWEIKLPENLWKIGSVTKISPHESGEYDVVSKILRDIDHYKRVEMRMIKKISEYDEYDPKFLIRKGSIRPSEMHPADFVDEKRTFYISECFNEYIRIKNECIRRDIIWMGVVIAPDQTRTPHIWRLFTKLIDKILELELKDWEFGILSSTVTDFDVLSILLNSGEFSSLVRVYPMRDIRDEVGDRFRRLYPELYEIYEEKVEEITIYSFYIKPDNNSRVVRVDFPLDLAPNETSAITLRNYIANTLFSKHLTTPIEWKGLKTRIPRIAAIAKKLSQDLLDELSDLLPLLIRKARGG